jgi:hypothetical protein
MCPRGGYVKRELLSRDLRTALADLFHWDRPRNIRVCPCRLPPYRADRFIERSPIRNIVAALFKEPDSISVRNASVQCHSN